MTKIDVRVGDVNLMEKSQAVVRLSVLRRSPLQLPV